MNPEHKKNALRMIPYGLYVLTAQSSDGQIAAATVNWVTQVSFEPPLIAVGVKVGSGPHKVIPEAGAFALNILGKDQQAAAYTFFKPVVPEGQTLGGEPFSAGSTGAPVLERVPGYVECSLVETVEKGDHAIIVGKVVDAGVSEELSGRPDDLTLTLKDLGEKIYYGG